MSRRRSAVRSRRRRAQREPSDLPLGAKVVKSSMGMEAEESMRNEFTAVVERDKRWYVAYCPEIPGANGQGRTKSAALKSLTAAIALILEDRRKAL